MQKTQIPMAETRATTPRTATRTGTHVLFELVLDEDTGGGGDSGGGGGGGGGGAMV